MQYCQCLNCKRKGIISERNIECVFMRKINETKVMGFVYKCCYCGTDTELKSSQLPDTMGENEIQ